jgi:pyrroline-5-carboxylate reductase
VLTNKRIGIIGSGNMARALVSGLLRTDRAERELLTVSNHKKEKCELFTREFGVETTSDNSAVVERSDIVVLAIKPQVMRKVLREVSSRVTAEKLVISIAAGVSLESIEKLLPKNTRVVRVMPNIPAIVDAGISAISAGSYVQEGDLKTAEAIFSAVGRTVFVDEDQLDAVTGLSGSGPAYIFLIIDALADAGVKVGLSRDVALELAAQTVLGAAKLLIETGEHPGKLKDRVTSPGGTAIAGIHTLEEGGLRTTLINAVERASQRSRELGKLFESQE